MWSGRAKPAVAADHRMLEARHKALVEYLGMIEHVLDRLHRRIRHTVAEQRRPFLRGAGGQAFAKAWHQYVRVRDPAHHCLAA